MSSSNVIDFNSLTSTQNTSTTQVYSTFSSIFNTNNSNDDVAFNNLLNIHTYPGYSYMDNLAITNKLQELEKNFDNSTEGMKIASVLQNTSSYVKETQDMNNKILNTHSTTSLNNLYKSRQDFERTKNEESLVRFEIMNLKTAMFFSILIGSSLIAVRLKAPMYSMKTAIIISVCIFVVYILAVIIFYMNWLQKRNDDWSKLYFKPPKQVQL